MTGWLMRALASGLMLHATFPLEVLAQTTPSSTAAPETPAVTTQPSPAAAAAAPSAAAIAPSVPPAARVLPAETSMTAGDRGQVQEALHRLDYLQGPIDGIFGPLTRAAISRFQHDIGAASTGYLTEEEANRLVGTPAAVAPTTTGQAFSKEQIDALVASIALYPDDLLTQVLMASTFPLEVVAAARWLEDPAHKSMSGDALVKALETEPWDPSVKSLVPLPAVLATMNGNLPWLQQLGYAFATQQADVFDAVQRLRRLAQANDKLQSSPQQIVSTQQVTVEPAAGSSQPPTQQQIIVIQPAEPNTVYVPSYNPIDGVRLVVALPVLSAVLCGPTARLLSRHSLSHRAGVCGRRRGRGWAMGLGASWLGRRLRRRQCQPIQQHQRESVANLFKPLGRGRWEWAGWQFRPPTRRAGGRSGSFANLCSGQCSAASDTPGRCGRRRRCRRPGWGGSAGWRRWCRRPGWRGSTGRSRRCRRPGWGGSAGRRRRAGGLGGAGRRQVGVGGAGGLGGAGRPVASAVLVVLAVRAVSGMPAGRPAGYRRAAPRRRIW